MAEADRKVRITIETKGDGSGARAVAKELEKISEETKEISQRTDFYDFDAALKRTAPKLEDLDKWAKKAAVSKSQLGSKVQQVGYQVQDFAVQVQSGTSALTAFSQQGSQLLGMFGPGGAIAGALLAVGAIAVKVLTDTGDSSKTAAEKAQELATALEDIREKGEALSKADIDFSLQAMEAATKQAEALRDRYKESLKAQDDANTAGLSNLLKLTAALQELDRLEGAKIDKQKQANILADIEKKQREEAARQQVAAANKQLEDAKAKLASDQAAIANAQEQRRLNVQNLTYLQQQIGELKVRKKLLEETSKEVLPNDTRFAGTGAAPLQIPTVAASNAKAELARTDFEKRIADLEGMIKGVVSSDAAIKALEEATANAVISQQRVDDLSVAIPIKIAEIQQTLATADIAGKIETLADENKVVLDATNEQVASLKDLSPKQQKLVDEIKGTTSDLTITNQEAAENVRRLLTLQGTLKTSQTSQSTNIQSLIEISSALIATTNRQKVEIDGLKKQIGIIK